MAAETPLLWKTAWKKMNRVFKKPRRKRIHGSYHYHIAMDYQTGKANE